MELDQLRALMIVAEAGNFLEAARISGTARTTLRRRVEALKASFGIRLLHRHGQELTLTPTGRELVGRARILLQDADRVEQDLREQIHDPTTKVTVHIPIGVHPMTATMTLAQVRARFSDFRVVVHYREHPVEALAQGGDFALWWGPTVPDGPWKARRIGTIPLGLIAHRAYAEAHGLPRTLEELHEHPLFTPSLPGLSPTQIPLRSGGLLAVSPTMASDNLIVGWEAARHGIGIALGVTVNLPGDGWPAEDKCLVLPDLVGFDLPLWLVLGHAMRERPALEPLVADIEAVLASATSGG